MRKSAMQIIEVLTFRLDPNRFAACSTAPERGLQRFTATETPSRSGIIVVNTSGEL